MTKAKKKDVREELDSHPVDYRLVGDASEQGDTRRYLEGILGQYKELKYKIQLARSTPRQKVAESTISIFLARAQSLAQYLACGGEAAPVDIQQEIFGPVYEYWYDLYGRGSKDSDD